MVVLLEVFVNDILIVSASDTLIAHVKMFFHEKLRIKDMGVTEDRIRQLPGLMTIIRNSILRVG